MTTYSSIPSLDQAIQNTPAGFPQGILAELCGPRSHVAALAVLRSAQARGHLCALVDGGHDLGYQQIRDAGVDNDLLVAQPALLEQALEMSIDLIRCGLRVVVISGYSGMATPSEMCGGEASFEVERVETRTASRAVMRLQEMARARGALVLFVRPTPLHTRHPASMAVRFYSHLIVETRLCGKTLWADVRKNKLGAAGAAAQIDPPGAALFPMCL